MASREGGDLGFRPLEPLGEVFRGQRGPVGGEDRAKGLDLFAGGGRPGCLGILGPLPLGLDGFGEGQVFLHRGDRGDSRLELRAEPAGQRKRPEPAILLGFPAFLESYRIRVPWAFPDLNRGPSDYESRALTN